MQAGLSLGQGLGPARLALDGDLKNYLPYSTDGPDEPGLMVNLRPAIEIPVADGLSLDLGVDYFLFAGKVPANQSLGSSVTPRVGLSYDATWKPLSGVTY